MCLWFLFHRIEGFFYREGQLLLSLEFEVFFRLLVIGYLGYFYVEAKAFEILLEVENGGILS